jgi:hypothetical protein
MAKVIGPLHSLVASGDFGKILTYRRVGHNNVVSEYAAPTDNRSTPQTVHRTAMRTARAAWRALSSTEQQEWNQQAKPIPGTSGYNLFIKEYLNQYYSQIKPPFNSLNFDTKNFC